MFAAPSRNRRPSQVLTCVSYSVAGPSSPRKRAREDDDEATGVVVKVSRSGDGSRRIVKGGDRSVQTHRTL